MVKETRKLHHAVPKFYIKRFAKADGLVYLHDKQRLSVVRVHPDAAIAENYLYAPEVGETPYDDSFEKFLSDHVDSPAAPIIEKLTFGDSISDEERSYMALFLAFQDMRIPRTRDLIAKFMGNIGRKLLRMQAQHPDSMKRILENMGEKVSDERIRDLADDIKRNEFVVEPTKVMWLESMSIAVDIAEVIYRMPWIVAEAHPDIEFITSDAPIAKILTDRSIPRIFGVGWLSPSVESTFTLSPSHCLIIRPDRKEGRYEAPKSWCKNVNRRLILQARRFVISRNRDSYIEIISKK